MRVAFFLSTAVIASAISTWHVVWTGGQSNSVGTNSQKSGQYPTWATTDRIMMFCALGFEDYDGTIIYPRGTSCQSGAFTPAEVPLFNEVNVAFSQTYANLLLQTLPDTDGVVLLNTGVGGTGFQDGQWVVPNGPLAVRSVKAMEALAAALPSALNGTFSLHSMLWHQGEEDAGDNGQSYHADYCTYLVNDLAALIDFLRAGFPGGSPSTPFITGGMLPYWQHNVIGGVGEVPDALVAINTSRVCSANAAAPFPDFLPNGAPFGDPLYRSGISHDVIHFTAMQAMAMGAQYWDAYQYAVNVTTAVPSNRTVGCPGSNAVQPPVSSCAQ